MTYEKAVGALVKAKLLSETQSEAALETLSANSVEFTYPDWARALAKAGLIKKDDVENAEQVMEMAAHHEAQEEGDDFDAALRSAGIL